MAQRTWKREQIRQSMSGRVRAYCRLPSAWSALFRALHTLQIVTLAKSATCKMTPSIQFDLISQGKLMQVNIYMGLGLLSMPYAMRLSGWLGIASLGLITATFCLSAKLLIRSFQTLPPGIPHTYANLGAAIQSSPKA